MIIIKSSAWHYRLLIKLCRLNNCERQCWDSFSLLEYLLLLVTNLVYFALAMAIKTVIAVCIVYGGYLVLSGVSPIVLLTDETVPEADFINLVKFLCYCLFLGSLFYFLVCHYGEIERFWNYLNKKSPVIKVAQGRKK